MVTSTDLKKIKEKEAELIKLKNKVKAQKQMDGEEQDLLEEEAVEQAEPELENNKVTTLVQTLEKSQRQTAFDLHQRLSRSG